MKYFKYLFTFVITLSTFSFVNAMSCSNDEANSISQSVANITAKYETNITEEQHEDGVLKKRSFTINIVNISDKVYVKITNDKDTNIVKLTSADANNGIISYKTNKVNEVVKYTISIFTSDNTGCPNERVKTLYVTTPRYNKFFNYSICKEHPDDEYCIEFVLLPELKENDFFDRMEKKYSSSKIENTTTNENGNEKTKSTSTKILENPVVDFICEYNWWIIGVLVGVEVAIVIIIIRNKTKKQRELGL